ncbi:proline dehydrogenase family protein [Actinophytocola sp.]|uniref:proline dehydrogenase family protein n=1 Tax=Actinophytocola sp. TaxID=1872138 RepID=UPI002ECFE4A9
MVRTALLAAARSDRCRALIEDMRPTRQVVARFVAGNDVAHAIAASSVLAVDREVTLDLLGESTMDAEQADATVVAYTRLLDLLDRTGLTSRVEISLKLSAIGGSLPMNGKRIALANARRVCEAAASVGTTVTVDMEDHTTTDQTLETVRALRVDFPWVGAVLQAHLRRTEQDCRELAGPGSRVRLCKGAYREPSSVAYQRKSEVDRAYVRCLRILMAGKGYPMVATHDPRLVAITEKLAVSRAAGSFEYQMLYGIRPREQDRITARGRRMRVYVPYGDQWYPYFMRRLAERPANLVFFLRSLATTH